MPKRLRYSDKLQQIYALIDPRDNATRYVGRSDDVNYRFSQHLQGGDKRNIGSKSYYNRASLPFCRYLETIEETDNPLAKARERED